MAEVAGTSSGRRCRLQVSAACASAAAAGLTQLRSPRRSETFTKVLKTSSR
jgi:hypothetical protein